MRYPIIAVALFCAVVSGRSEAQPRSPDPCVTQANTIEIDDCLRSRLKSRDKAMNMAYRDLLKQIDAADPADGVDYPRARRLLIEAQRAWISFRDNDCKGRTVLYEGGSIRGAVATGCLIAHTERRTTDLRRWMLVN